MALAAGSPGSTPRCGSLALGQVVRFLDSVSLPKVADPSMCVCAFEPNIITIYCVYHNINSSLYMYIHSKTYKLRACCVHHGTTSQASSSICSLEALFSPFHKLVHSQPTPLQPGSHDGRRISLRVRKTPVWRTMWTMLGKSEILWKSMFVCDRAECGRQALRYFAVWVQLRDWCVLHVLFGMWSSDGADRGSQQFDVLLHECCRRVVAWWLMSEFKSILTPAI